MFLALRGIIHLLLFLALRGIMHVLLFLALQGGRGVFLALRGIARGELLTCSYTGLGPDGLQATPAR